MNLMVNTSELQQALKIVSKALPARPVKDILSGILMECDIGKPVTLTAGDGQMFVKTKLPILNADQFSTVLPGKQITALASKLTGQQTEIEVNENKNAIVRCYRSRTTMPVMNAYDYPSSDSVNGFSVCIMQYNLQKLINGVMHAVSNDSTRVILQGILFEITEDGITTTALDGFRMAQCKYHNPIIMPDGENKLRYVVPANVCKMIVSCMTDTSADCKLTFGNNRIIADLDGVTVMASLLAGEYLDYNKIIPKQFAHIVQVSRHELLECIDRSMLTASENSNNGKLIHICISGDTMQVNANGAVSTNAEELDTLYNNDPNHDFTIAFNGAYLIDAVKASEDAQIQMRMNTSVTPLIITNEADNRLQLVLPTRVMARSDE